MEAFSLLKYWRGAGGGGGGGDVRAATGTTSIVTAASHDTVETQEEDDDGPFFDLEFAVPDEEDGDERNKDNGDNVSDCEEDGEDEGDENDDVESDGTDGEGEGEFKFTLSSGSSNDRTDHTLSLSPSDDLFFKGRLVPIEPSSLVYSGSEQNPKSQFPVSLLKSATKFRVFMLGFKKSKGNGGEKTEQNGSAANSTPKQQQKQEAQQDESKQSKLFTVKFKVEEVPIMSLFTRDNSSRSSSGNKSQKQNEESASSDEKRFSKDVMQKYLKKVKPLYVRVSRRYGEKLKFSGQLSLGTAAKTAPPPPPQPPVAQKSTAEKSPTEATEVVSEAPASNVKGQKQGNFPAGLRVVCKHLGKSKSASSAVAAAPPGPVASRRRDDSLLQQQDGIQSAILHCKRSFNASRDAESTLLARSASES